MTDRQNPVDRALDLFVYAPLGLALSARDLLPALIEKGRQQVTGQVTTARMIGEFAVTAGQQEATKTAKRLQEQAGQALSELGLLRPPAPPAPPAPPRRAAASPEGNGQAPARTPAPAAASAPAPAAPRGLAATAPTAAASASTTSPAPAPSVAVGDLAIPGYDTLSASQVVQRLDGLSRDELEAVRSYEQSGRGRKTILAKIAQLQLAG